MLGVTESIYSSHVGQPDRAAVLCSKSSFGQTINILSILSKLAFDSFVSICFSVSLSANSFYKCHWLILLQTVPCTPFYTDRAFLTFTDLVSYHTIFKMTD